MHDQENDRAYKEVHVTLFKPRSKPSVANKRECNRNAPKSPKLS